MKNDIFTIFSHVGIELGLTHRIHIFGASGSGASTLGLALANEIDGKFLDTDDYYWENTDPPFTLKRKPEDRVAIIKNEIASVNNWVLSGSLCSWGGPLLPQFTLAVFLQLSSVIRMQRILARERDRYGDRIEPGGDMHGKHVEFVNWARSYDFAKAPTRSLDLHETWMKELPCPVVRLDSALQLNELTRAVLEFRDN